MFLARAGADVVRIKVFLAISKCAFERALLAHFAVFVSCALPKVASRAQNRCFSYCIGIIHIHSVEHFYGAE